MKRKLYIVDCAKCESMKEVQKRIDEVAAQQALHRADPEFAEEFEHSVYDEIREE